MSNIIKIDLTQAMANVGVPVPFVAQADLDSSLLTYPNSVLQKVLIDFDVVFEKQHVNVYGTITCCVNGFCDKCLDEISRQIELPFDQFFYKDSAQEPDAYLYFDSVLDVTKAVCDEILLSMPMSLLCKDDCKGLCPKCGTNLNNKTCNCNTTKENPFSVLKNLKI